MATATSKLKPSPNHFESNAIFKQWNTEFSVETFKCNVLVKTICYSTDVTYCESKAPYPLNQNRSNYKMQKKNCKDYFVIL